MIWSVAPVSAPLKAWNGEPGSTLIATGAPVIAACFAGSVYIAKRLSAGAGRTTAWEMMVRIGGHFRFGYHQTPEGGTKQWINPFGVRQRIGRPSGFSRRSTAWSGTGNQRASSAL